MFCVFLPGKHISLVICVRRHTYHGETHITVTAAEARWEEVLSSIDGLLIETESQENKSSPRVSRSRTTPKHT